jgi:hypothetical protein
LGSDRGDLFACTFKYLSFLSCDLLELDGFQTRGKARVLISCYLRLEFTLGVRSYRRLTYLHWRTSKRRQVNLH